MDTPDAEKRAAKWRELHRELESQSRLVNIVFAFNCTVLAISAVILVIVAVDALTN